VSFPEAIVFDKDGTLIDVHDTWGPVFATIIPEMAADRAEAVATALGVDLADASLAADSIVIAGSNADIVAVMSPLLGRTGAELLAELEPRIEALATDHALPLPATAPVLDALAEAGVWMGVGTNDSVAAAERQLEHLGWRHHFASVLGYDSGFGIKPEPGMLHESARRAGVAIGDLVFVGDSDTDRRTAAAAGCPFVLIGPDRPLNEVLSLP